MQNVIGLLIGIELNMYIAFHSLGIILTKEIKDLFNENYKSLMREIKEGIRRWKELPSSLLGSINISNDFIVDLIISLC
jgi:hypothetical protein